MTGKKKTVKKQRPVREKNVSLLPIALSALLPKLLKGRGLSLAPPRGSGMYLRLYR